MNPMKCRFQSPNLRSCRQTIQKSLKFRRKTRNKYRRNCHRMHQNQMNMNSDDLNRFLEAQEKDYATALAEIRNGSKRSHWMWYIFPQVKGLGFSGTSKYYAVNNLDEAEAFMQHAVLGPRLVEICEALLQLKSNNPNSIFGNPDDMKLRSSMTLFASLPSPDPVFQAVLDKYFNGEKDTKTLNLLNL
jgi:uncharacterized protein (DUF1810 family)